MIKILVKAAILVCIILSIYFIVNPSACSNLMSGRVINSMEELPTFIPKEKEHQELLVPTGDKGGVEETSSSATSTLLHTAPETISPASPAFDPQVQSHEPVVSPVQSSYTQEQTDYAIASRYVELENEYLKQHKDMQKAAKEISYIVMDDFELTPSEWEAFLQRATTDNLFEKVRQQKTEQ